MGHLRSSRRAERRLVLVAALVAAAACTVTACTSASSDATAAPRVASIELSPDASQFQREVVALYEAGGTVTFEDYRQAVDDTKACLVGAGFEIYSEHQLENSGRPTLIYEAKAPTALVEQRGEGAFDAIYTECWQNHSAVVEALYSASATPIESVEREIAKVKAQYAPLIEECLRELGIAKPAGADDEWWGAAAIEANQTLPGNPDCMQSTGYFAATDAIPGVSD